MHRFYADPMLSDERCFFLNADDTVHAVKVLRMQTNCCHKAYQDNFCSHLCVDILCMYQY